MGLGSSREADAVNDDDHDFAAAETRCFLAVQPPAYSSSSTWNHPARNQLCEQVQARETYACNTSRDGSTGEPAARKSNIFRGELPEGRMPGLIPFTTVEYEEPLADQLFDRAMLHGWLSCIGVARSHTFTPLSCSCIHARQWMYMLADILCRIRC